ncbi:GNAT family N-acetyltransferase [Cycloclasticus sp. 46_120_T64]|nr:GNAT family N-acetyltransferase [Cycloclasticus sp. 46_120_T64]
MQVDFLNSINDISVADWSALFGDDYPFTRHPFLLALESSGCTQASTGWQAQHIIVRQDEQLIAAMPCFLKNHSYGEYVFDWAWANAYQHHGHRYYPKLVAAIPFTPAAGPRLSFAASIQNPQQQLSIIKNIEQALRDKSRSLGLSSWHVLFPLSELSSLLEDCGWQQRLGIQYHWFNQEYISFDDFLQRMKARKRKNIRKERLAVQQQGISISTLLGSEISEQVMHQFYRFYQKTYLKRSAQAGYLNLPFFQSIRRSLQDNLVMFCAHKGDQLIAAALCFKDSQTLYGRYWGCEQEYELLHFETCYYQGIEFCIQNRLARFDPGAQGEHKIPRGFEPIHTFSNHVILNPDFDRAISRFIQHEKTELNSQMPYLQGLLPFKTET